MSDWKFSLGEIETTNYRKAKRNIKTDSIGRRLQRRKRSYTVTMYVNSDEFAKVKKQIDDVLKKINKEEK